MAENKTVKKAEKTPRQLEIAKLQAIGQAKRTEQQQSRFDQLRAEEKRDRFLRLAVKRVKKAQLALVNVARMANKNVYQYTQDEAAKISNAIKNACDKVVDAYAGTKEKQDYFTL